jgi:protein CWC15
MTTAHRPTWAPAKGHEEQGGARMFGPSKKHSKLDDNAHTILKTRAVGQMSVKELVARDFKAELLAKEAKHFKRKLPEAGGDLMIGDGEANGSERVRSIDGPSDGDAGPSGSDAPAFEPKRVDADDSDDDDDDDASDDESDSEDDTAALLAELERIKKERADAAARREADDAERDALEKAEALASGNPLLDLKDGKDGRDDAEFLAKRRWDDDVVFKNQTRGEPRAKKRFVNDTIRSDFHRRFLNKYIK